ncbi:hypothetical protein RQN30_10280 [Arcanobacterium hippocoleae]
MDEQIYIFSKNGQSVPKYEKSWPEKSWPEIEAEDTEWIEIAVNQAQIEEGILYVSPTMTIISDFDDNCLQNLLSIEKNIYNIHISKTKKISQIPYTNRN